LNLMRMLPTAQYQYDQHNNSQNQNSLITCALAFSNKSLQLADEQLIDYVVFIPIPILIINIPSLFQNV
jgi:uncharacterized iron-regulated protein